MLTISSMPRVSCPMAEPTTFCAHSCRLSRPGLRPTAPEVEERSCERLPLAAPLIGQPRPARSSAPMSIFDIFIIA